MSEPSPLPRFRIYFHDGKTIDVSAAISLIAERQARIKHPGGYVKKVKLLRENDK